MTTPAGSDPGDDRVAEEADAFAQHGGAANDAEGTDLNAGTELRAVFDNRCRVDRHIRRRCGSSR